MHVSPSSFYLLYTWCVCGTCTYMVCMCHQVLTVVRVQLLRVTFLPPMEFWGLFGKHFLPLNFLAGLYAFCLLFIHRLDTNRFLLLAVWTVLGAALGCLVSASALFPHAEELLCHSGTPGVLLANPSGCVLPVHF